MCPPLRGNWVCAVDGFLEPEEEVAYGSRLGGPSLLMGCSVHTRREEGTPSACAQAGVHSVTASWGIINSISFHTYLLDSYYVYVPVLWPCLVKVLAGWRGRGPDKRMVKWRDLCCRRTGVGAAHPGLENHSSLPNKLPPQQ